MIEEDTKMKLDPVENPEIKKEEINPIYLEFKKALTQMEKSVSIKDAKTLGMFYKQVNKYRKKFNQDDQSFLADILISRRLPFRSINPINQSEKENLFTRFNFSSKQIAKIQETLEITSFVSLILITALIDRRLYSEAFEHLTLLMQSLRKSESPTLFNIRAKAYYFLCFMAEKLDRFHSIIK